MPEEKLFEYAVIRMMPRVEREEFLNIGVVLYCNDEDFLEALFEINETRIKGFSPGVNITQVREYLNAFEQICKGNPAAGPISQLPIAERFRWLTAARSTILQTSSVHSGLCSDGARELEKLYKRLVCDPH